jgi:hypothetical protein
MVTVACGAAFFNWFIAIMDALRVDCWKSFGQLFVSSRYL